MSTEDVLDLSNIPAPAERNIAVHIDHVAERAIRQGHPWLFQDSITKISHTGRSGDLAILFDRKRRFLAVGLFDPLSPIRVRILQHSTPTPIGKTWFQERIATAFNLRDPQLGTQTSGYRLVHGENDGLPGLIVDRYDRTYVIKLYTTAWIPHLRYVLSALAEIVKPEGVVLRFSRSLSRQGSELHGLSDGVVLSGNVPNTGVTFLENGLWFEADVLKGQKTGFFLDQRDNRERVEKLAREKNVLNVFAYTGGFCLYAARGGARRVVSLDISRLALAGAERNFELNRRSAAISAANHEMMQGDAFELLDKLNTDGQRFDMVIIDPPSFARRQADSDRALSAYRRLVLLGLGVLKPEGTLVMASCTSRVPASIFFELVHETAASARRPLREIERSLHPLDHPIGFKEGAYLKCLYAIAP